MKHKIFSCSRGNIINSILYSSLKTKPNLFKDFEYTSNNSDPLTYVYNICLEQYKSDNIDSVIFIHDDVELVTENLYEELEKAYFEYDIVGLAGGINPTIKSPGLWHLIIDPKNYRGKVGHCIDNHKFITDFGPTPARVLLLDGLFLAFNLNKVKNTKFKFDEQFDFHFYDLDACLCANEQKLKMGVWPISVYHYSPGLRDLNDKNFKDNQIKFLAKYS